MTVLFVTFRQNGDAIVPATTAGGEVGPATAAGQTGQKQRLPRAYTGSTVVEYILHSGHNNSLIFLNPLLVV